jgi:hypothetical protein
MPDIQTEMQKILQAWDKPEVPETTQPTEQPKGKRMFAPSNNVSQDTFNFIRDNAGLPRHDVVRLLVQQGHKKSSVSSLIGQMLRQGLVWQGVDGALYPNAKEYAPIKSARTLANQAKKAAEKSSKLKTSKKYKTKEVPVPAGIASLVEEHKTHDEVQHIMNTISLPNAKRLHKALNEYFGSV